MKFLLLPRNPWVVLASVLFVTTTAFANVPPVIMIETTKGDVRFSHLNHQILAQGECGQCHHEGAGVHRCIHCHDGEHVRHAREVLHQMCKGCHNAHETSETPQSCESCHQ